MVRIHDRPLGSATPAATALRYPRRVAQWTERWPSKPMVAGSNPAAPVCPAVDSGSNAGDDRLRGLVRQRGQTADRSPAHVRRAAGAADLDRLRRGERHPHQAQGQRPAAADDARPPAVARRPGRGLGAARGRHGAARQYLLRDDHPADQRRGRRARLAAERRDRPCRAGGCADLRRGGRHRRVRRRGRSARPASSRSSRTSGGSWTSSRRTTSCATNSRRQSPASSSRRAASRVEQRQQVGPEPPQLRVAERPGFSATSASSRRCSRAGSTIG